MKKIIASTIGVVLAASALSAFAGKDDRENFAQCKADVNAYYGESTRVRLRSIKQRSGESHLTMMVTPKGGNNTVVVCAVDQEGLSNLQTRDGVALTTTPSAEKVSLAE